MARLLILGAGVMGSAIAVPAADNGHQVTLVGTHLDGEIIKALKADRSRHPRLKAPIPEAITPLEIEALSSESFRTADMVIVGVSSPGIGWTIDKLRSLMPEPRPIALVTKGLQPWEGRLRSFTESVAEALADQGVTQRMVMGIGGPCIAKELADRQPTAVIFAGQDRDCLERFRDTMQTAYYRVALSDDLEGVEVCAALKNFLAIAVSAMWTRYREVNPQPHKTKAMNPGAAAFSQAVREMAGLARWFGGRSETAYGVAGLGDLNVTVGGGRNSRLGFLLGEDMALEAALSGPLSGETLEGADTGLVLAAPLEGAFAAGRLDPADYPITRALIATIRDGKPLAIDFTAIDFV
ncbi:glycerol-3-phosphate dehydrogenase [Pelagibius litoralis]|uniref:Glycerol-3-phosphate dehydrogenase n=1 Tax=Pelagibius litoralis TaxID=374515 RepID=A0A967EVE0_9PROT|nr:glycerol-3-phosphate dehydrogenase [Pelagibius litoralis]NIA67714.1 glycerol-3-phosphate dehydrogenase [Pelagibius litoralis]